jgi:hypothetical protein
MENKSAPADATCLNTHTKNCFKVYVTSETNFSYVGKSKKYPQGGHLFMIGPNAESVSKHKPGWSLPVADLDCSHALSYWKDKHGYSAYHTHQRNVFLLYCFCNMYCLYFLSQYVFLTKLHCATYIS